MERAGRRNVPAFRQPGERARPATVRRDWLEQGVPVSLDGEKLPAVDLFIKLNRMAAANGIGRIDLVENRLVRMKSHGVYETPGGTVIHRAQAGEHLPRQAHDALQGYSSGEVRRTGVQRLVVRGCTGLDAFVNVTQENVTGTVRLKLYKGNIIIAGRKSPFSLYREDMPRSVRRRVATRRMPRASFSCSDCR